MPEVVGSELEYSFDSARLVGYFCAPKGGSGVLPGVVLVHDAFGVGDYMKRKAEQVAELGYAVLAADVWGDGKQLHDESEIGPMIGRFAQDRKTWMGRLNEAQQLLCAQEGVDSRKVAFAGYCFGGASVLEYVRTGGKIRGAVSFHGGLNLVGDDWSGVQPSSKVLILTGFDDPMADSEKLLTMEKSMTAAGVDWESNIFGHTKHGFTRPDSDRANKPQVVGYSAQSDKRSWAAMTGFLQEIFSA